MNVTIISNEKMNVVAPFIETMLFNAILEYPSILERTGSLKCALNFVKIQTAELQIRSGVRGKLRKQFRRF